MAPDGVGSASVRSVRIVRRCHIFDVLDHRTWLSGIRWTDVSLWTAAAKSFNAVLQEEVELAQREAASDFHVVLQPFMTDYIPR